MLGHAQEAADFARRAEEGREEMALEVVHAVESPAATVEDGRVFRLRHPGRQTVDAADLFAPENQAVWTAVLATLLGVFIGFFLGRKSKMG